MKGKTIVKNLIVGFCLALPCLFFFNGCSKQGDFPMLTGPYLGQKPPGMTPEIFAPGIVSTGYDDVCIAFSPDGKELFFGLWEEPPHIAILHMKEENGRWTAPQIASFSGRYSDLKFNISPDGNKLIFSSNRPLKGEGIPINFWHLWIAEKTDTGWSDPINFGPVINTDKGELYPSISENGNLYFFSDFGDGQGGCDILVSKLVAGYYTQPRKLGTSINTDLNEGDSFIAPDERYIIFCCRDRDDGYGSNDLYISFQKDDGSWTEAKNMGEKINTSANEICPSVSSDGKYLFFSSSRNTYKSYSDVPYTYERMVKQLNGPGSGYGDIYWMDARIIEDLKEIKLK
jgi:Tol biopolymer transport system component